MKNINKFNYLSQSAADFQEIDWKQGIKSIAVNGQSHDGQIFIEIPTGAIVFKSTDTASTDIFLNRMAVQLGVLVPRMRAVCYDEAEFKSMMRAIEKKCHSQDPVYKLVLSRLNRPFYEVMEYIRGVDFKSTGASRFQRIFNQEGRLVQLGSIIGFDMIINNDDRLPLYHEHQGGPQTILFSIEPKESATWEMIQHDNNSKDIAFGSIYAVNTKHGIMQPDKQNITDMLVKLRKFLHDAFSFAQQLFTQTEQQEVKTPPQFERMNKYLANYCLCVMEQQQLLAILKGIVLCLDRYLKRLNGDKIKQMKDSLMKGQGQWEETYWNHALRNLSEIYFQSIYKVVSAQWTVYEQTILKILNYSYVTNKRPSEPSQEHIKIQQNNSEESIDIQEPQPAPLLSHRTAQPEVNQSLVNRVSKSNSVKNSVKGSEPSIINNKNRIKSVKKSQFDTGDRAASKQKEDEVLKKQSLPNSKVEQQGKKKLNYSKLDDKIRKFKERNE